MFDWEFYQDVIRRATIGQAVRVHFIIPNEPQEDNTLKVNFRAEADGFFLIWDQYHPPGIAPIFRINSETGEIQGQGIRRMTSALLKHPVFPWLNPGAYDPEQPGLVKTRSFALYFDSLVLVTDEGINELYNFIETALGQSPSYIVLDT